MSDFYKCEHGEPMCGTCTRALKTQYEALLSENAKLKAERDRMKEALKEISVYPDNHEGGPEPCSCHYCIADIAKSALGGEGK